MTSGVVSLRTRGVGKKRSGGIPSQPTILRKVVRSGSLPDSTRESVAKGTPVSADSSLRLRPAFARRWRRRAASSAMSTASVARLSHGSHATYRRSRCRSVTAGAMSTVKAVPGRPCSRRPGTADLPPGCQVPSDEQRSTDREGAPVQAASPSTVKASCRRSPRVAPPWPDRRPSTLAHSFGRT